MPCEVRREKTFPKATILDICYEANLSTSKHEDGNHRISMVLGGKLKEKACGKEVFAQCGSIVLKPGDLTHQNDFGPKKSRIVSVAFKEDSFKEIVGEQPIDWCWYQGLPTANIAFKTARELAKVTKEEDFYDCIVDLLAQLQEASKETKKEAPSWLNLIEERMKDEFSTSLKTKDLATWLDIHPVYLARIFRRHYGCSVKDYLQDLRISQAVQDLSNGKKALVHIALDAGFSDQSHMTRLFQKGMNTSPGVFRKWLKEYEI